MQHARSLGGARDRYRDGFYGAEAGRRTVRRGDPHRQPAGPESSGRGLSARRRPAAGRGHPAHAHAARRPAVSRVPPARSNRCTSTTNASASRRWWPACGPARASRWSPTRARRCMSDPGSLLVAAAARAGVEVVSRARSMRGDRRAVDRRPRRPIVSCSKGFLPREVRGASRELSGACAGNAHARVLRGAAPAGGDARRPGGRVRRRTRSCRRSRNHQALRTRLPRHARGAGGTQCATDANMSRGESCWSWRGAPGPDDEAADALAAERTLGVLLQELPVSQAARIAAQLTRPQPQGAVRARTRAGAAEAEGLARRQRILRTGVGQATAAFHDVEESPGSTGQGAR